jgi:hypothetical protein
MKLQYERYERHLSKIKLAEMPALSEVEMLVLSLPKCLYRACRDETASPEH